MKETTNFTLWIYEHTFDKIKLKSSIADGLLINLMKLIPALILFPVLLTFIIIALLIEEPIKCLIFLILRKTTLAEVKVHYKKCWKSLQGGMQNDV